jgi:hypothetical protein
MNNIAKKINRYYRFLHLLDRCMTRFMQAGCFVFLAMMVYMYTHMKAIKSYEYVFTLLFLTWFVMPLLANTAVWIVNKRIKYLRKRGLTIIR